MKTLKIFSYYVTKEGNKHSCAAPTKKEALSTAPSAP